MWVQSNDDVRLMVEQENVDKNPCSICQGRNIYDKKKIESKVFPCIFNIVINISIYTWKSRVNNGRKVVYKTRMRAYTRRKVVTVCFPSTLVFAIFFISFNSLFFFFLYIYFLLFFSFYSMLFLKKRQPHDKAPAAIYHK